MNKLIHLLERTLNSRSKKLTKQDEYMFFSPFVSHYKPKLQINMSSQKWHCWVSNQGGYSLYSLFKKINADSRYFNELKDIVFVPTKKEEKEFLINFNKVVTLISKQKEINSTLLFSKKGQKDFLRNIINDGLKYSCNELPKWRKDLVLKDLSGLFESMNIIGY